MTPRPWMPRRCKQKQKLELSGELISIYLIRHGEVSTTPQACMNGQLSARRSLTYKSENPPISFPIILSFQSHSIKMKVKCCSLGIMSLYCVCLKSKCLKFVSSLCPLKQMTISVSFVLVLSSVI